MPSTISLKRRPRWAEIRTVLKMGPERPTKTKSFLRHIGAMLGQGSTAEQIDAVVAELEQAGVVRVEGDLVLYG